MSNSGVISRLRTSFLLLGSAGILTYLCYSYYGSSQQAAIAAVNSLETCRRQASEIQGIRDRPVFASTVVEEVGELTRRIGSARKIAAITEQAVDLVDPQSPVRLGDSSYRQRPVAIDLRGLELAQIARFTDALTDREKGMWVNELRLTPVRSGTSSQEPETWNVELVLTQVNYSPKRQ